MAFILRVVMEIESGKLTVFAVRMQFGIHGGNGSYAVTTCLFSMFFDEYSSLLPVNVDNPLVCDRTKRMQRCYYLDISMMLQAY